jgi:hypothetical protein
MRNSNTPRRLPPRRAPAKVIKIRTKPVSKRRVNLSGGMINPIISNVPDRVAF